MIKVVKEFTITAKETYGHRKVTHLINQIRNLKSTITIKNDEVDRVVNAKSLIGLLSLAIKTGDKFVVSVLNDNEEQLCHDVIQMQKILGEK